MRNIKRGKKGLEANDWAYLLALFPLFATIFCAEPQHKRIFTAIGAN